MMAMVAAGSLVEKALAEQRAIARNDAAALARQSSAVVAI
jgi:hypothetical protein